MIDDPGEPVEPAGPEALEPAQPGEPERPVEPAAPAAPEVKFHTLSFTGVGSEYFKIWIVNLALSIVTLGVYSAWAKVRRLQYFYRHTRLAGAGFDYHANPIALLKGRIVGLILFGLYSATGYVDWRVAAGIFLGLAIVMPWLLGRSLRFRFHNSSYRGLRFRFHGTTGQAYWIFLAFPIFTFLSLFTLGPMWHHRLKRYQFSNAAFGTSRFTLRTEVGDFYITYVFAVFLFVCLFAMVVVAFVLAGIVAAVASGPSTAPSTPPELQITPAFIAMMVVAGALYAFAIIAVQAVVTARIHNACWNQTRTEHHRFESQLSAWKLFGIQYTNFLATIFTLGLFRPFAQVRLVRYVAETLTVVGAAGFDVYGAAEAEDVTAVGEETAELFDFDIAF